jgi:hypothetical protein
MSYSFIAAVVGMLQADGPLGSLLGRKTDGSPAVYPSHYRDVPDPTFPMVTIYRLGSGMKDNMFAEDPMIGAQMDNPRIVLSVWDKKNIDRCYAAYRRIDFLLRGSPPTNTVPSHYMVNWKVRRRVQRDDLFDTAVNAYQLYSEYETWVYDNPRNPIPIPS